LGESLTADRKVNIRHERSDWRLRVGHDDRARQPLSIRTPESSLSTQPVHDDFSHFKARRSNASVRPARTARSPDEIRRKDLPACPRKPKPPR
jgi:hypothetical protein